MVRAMEKDCKIVSLKFMRDQMFYGRPKFSGESRVQEESYADVLSRLQLTFARSRIL